jgi:diguanylate cyclase (GGDEF)-like protein
VIIEDIEDIKESDPEMYSLLVPQDIHTLVASPLFYNGEIMGFYGVDNPPVESMKNISTLLQIMGHFIVALIRRKRLMDRLENLSYCDHLTGFGNRHAMNKYVKSINKNKSLGIVYCDVMGLKRVNDVMGHSEGDKLLQRACRCIKEVFTTDSALFRIGGDEFLVLCSGLDEKKFRGNIELVRALMLERCANMAIGSLWRPDGSEDFEKLLGEADGLMYEEKRKYYSGLPKKY